MTELTHVLRHLLPVTDPNALVDSSTRDDAAVYKLSDDRAIAVTVDFFTPVVDDPYDFGRIGAANALSDIYAMGARPLFGLNLVGFPRAMLGDGILEEILRGGAEVAAEAGIPVLGGHSIDDPEPKFGMVAVGEVHPDRMITNQGATDGDVLVLTKPLGSGVIATAIKAGAADPAATLAAIAWMAKLNRAAAEALSAAQVSAGTDVTGYGLLGHLRNLVAGSGMGAELSAAAIPVMGGARALVEAGHVPGGTARNLQDMESVVDYAPAVTRSTRILVNDAQTSGGLLLALQEDAVANFLSAVPDAVVIGRITADAPGRIRVME